MAEIKAGINVGNESQAVIKRRDKYAKREKSRITKSMSSVS